MSSHLFDESTCGRLIVIFTTVVFSAGEMKQEAGGGGGGGGGVFREGTPYQRRGSLQLWQFLVALLDDPGNAHFIAWTGRGMEFKLIEPEEVHATPVHFPKRQKMVGPKAPVTRKVVIVMKQTHRVHSQHFAAK